MTSPPMCQGVTARGNRERLLSNEARAYLVGKSAVGVKGSSAETRIQSTIGGEENIGIKSRENSSRVQHNQRMLDEAIVFSFVIMPISCLYIASLYCCKLTRLVISSVSFCPDYLIVRDRTVFFSKKNLILETA